MTFGAILQPPLQPLGTNPIRTPPGPIAQEASERLGTVLRSDRRMLGNVSRVLAVPAMAALLTACGSSAVPPTGSPTISPSTSSSTSGPTTTGPAAPSCGVVVSPDVAVTAQPEPCTVTTHVGATVHIVLDAGFRWDTPTSDSSIVEVVNVERQSSGRLDADLRARWVWARPPCPPPARSCARRDSPVRPWSGSGRCTSS